MPGAASDWVIRGYWYPLLPSNRRTRPAVPRSPPAADAVRMPSSLGKSSLVPYGSFCAVPGAQAACFSSSATARARPMVMDFPQSVPKAQFVWRRLRGGVAFFEQIGLTGSFKGN